MMRTLRVRDGSITTEQRRDLARTSGRPVRGLLARPRSRVAGIQLAGWVPKASSEKRYRVVLDANVEVPLPDGTILRGDLYRPKAPGAFPTLLAWSCYPKDFQHTGIPMPINEAGPVSNLVARGYCHFNVNARGTGQSGGNFNGLFSPEEQRDVAETIEWAARQPWCDGNLGMIGMSYFAVIQYLAAASNLRICGRSSLTSGGPISTATPYTTVAHRKPLSSAPSSRVPARGPTSVSRPASATQ